jgi:hypothetical protein
MYKKKIIFIFLSILPFTIQSGELNSCYKRWGHKLQGNFEFILETNSKSKNSSSFSAIVRGKIIAHENFSILENNKYKEAIFGSRRIFLKLPDKNPISLAKFLNEDLSEEELKEVRSFFFQDNNTVEILNFFTFKTVYQVTLQDGNLALVVLPESN